MTRESIPYRGRSNLSKYFAAASGSLLALSASFPSYSADLTLSGSITISDSLTYDGSSRDIDANDLPGSGEHLILSGDIKIDDPDVISHDDGGMAILTGISIDGTPSQSEFDVQVGEDGTDNSLTQTVADESADLTYSFYANTAQIGSNTYIALSYELSKINLNEDKNFSVDAEASYEDGEEVEKDLVAEITGKGSISYDAVDSQGNAHEGTLTVGGDKDNSYTGTTTVGTGADKVTIIAGRDNIFGTEGSHTSKLIVNTNSGVEFGSTSQYAGWLSGIGYLNLEDEKSSLTVINSLQADDDEAVEKGEVMSVSNELRGKGTLIADFGGNADTKGGYIDFTNASNDFSGTIVLKGAQTIASGLYAEVISQDDVTLILDDFGILNVGSADSDGQKSKVGNLIVGDKDSNATGFINFGTLDPDGDKDQSLLVNNLKVGQGEIDLEFTNFEDTATGLSQTDLLQADDGVFKKLLEIQGKLEGNIADLKLNIKDDNGDLSDGTQVNLYGEDGDTLAAIGTWEFDDSLVQDSTSENVYGLHYSLTEVNLQDTQGSGLVLSTDKDNQDFTALISGEGNLKISGEHAILLGKDGQENTYSGKTLVTQNTTVNFAENNAFGQTSQLTVDEGSAVDLKGHNQTVKDLEGKGEIIVADGARFTLDVDDFADEVYTVDNVFIGDDSSSGTVAVDLYGKELQFSSTTSFKGTVELTDTLIDLAANNNGSFLSDAVVSLKNNSSSSALKGKGILSFDASAEDSKFLAGLKSDGGIVRVDNLVIGDNSPNLVVNGEVSGSATVEFTVDFSVKDDLALINADDNDAGQSIISADLIAEGTSYVKDSSFTTLEGLSYSQNGTEVAKTDWTIGDISISGNDFNLGYSLTKIDILDGKTVQIGASEGDDFSLTAQVTDSTGKGNIEFTSGNIVFSNANNDYSGNTVIDENVTVTLGSDNTLGSTSELDLAANSSLLLYGTQQQVGKISGTGTIDLSTEGSLIAIDSTLYGTDADQEVSALISGNGTIETNLHGQSLSFSNESIVAGSWQGTLDLTDTQVSLEGKTADFLKGAALVLNKDNDSSSALNGQGVITVNGDDTVGSLEVQGGKIVFDGLVIGDDDSSHLTVSDALSGSGADVEFTDVSVSDSISLIDADNEEAKQEIISAGSVEGDPQFNVDSIDPIQGAEYKQKGVVVAKTDWTFDNTGLDKEDNSYSIGYQLTRIDLQENAADQALEIYAQDGGDTALTAQITGSGDINFKSNGTNSALTVGGGTANPVNDYTGKTTVTDSVTVTFAEDSAFGNTSSLNIDLGSTVVLNGFDQKVYGLTGLGTLDIDENSDFILERAETTASTSIENIISGSGIFSLINTGSTSFNNPGSGAFAGGFILNNASVTLTGNNAAVFDNAAVILEDDGRIIVENNDTTIGDLVFKGGNTHFTNVDFTGSDSNGSSLNVSSLDMSQGGSISIATGDLSIDNVLTADNTDNTGTSRPSSVLIASDSEIVGFDNKSVDVENVTAAIKDNGATVAYGVWDPELQLSSDNKSILVSAALSEVQLADAQGAGLCLDASGKSGEDATLQAKITDYVDESGEKVSGNLTIDDGNVIISNIANDYTGKTFISAGATLTLGDSEVLGNTSGVTVSGTFDVNGKTENIADLNVEAGGTVDLMDSGSQLITDGLSGTGTVDFGANSSGLLQVNIDSALAVAVNLDGSAGTFTVIGTGNTDSAVSFTRDNSFTGTYRFENSALTLAGDTYNSLQDASLIELDDSSMSIAAGDGLKTLNDLSLANNSVLSFTGISLGSANTEAKAVLVVDDLTVAESGAQLSVAAQIDADTDLLIADNENHSQTLINYTGNLDLKGKLTSPQTGLDASEYKQNGNTVAYVTWGGGNVKVKEEDKTISLEYGLTGIQLAADDGKGLVLSGTGKTGEDAVLSATVSDYTDDEGNVVKGDITFDGGAITVGSGDASYNTYTGDTFVKTDTIVNLAEDNALGNSSLTVEDRGHVYFGDDLANRQQTLAKIETQAANALSGYVNLTLGIDDGAEGTSSGESKITGENNLSGGSVVLVDNHKVKLDNTAGLGNLSVSGDGELELHTTGNNRLNNSLSGNVDLELITDEDEDGNVKDVNTVTLAGNNSDWTGKVTVNANTKLVAEDASDISSRIGSSSLVVDGEVSLREDESWTLTNAVSGSGFLNIDAGSVNNTFDFSSTVGRDFSGTVVLNNATLNLGGNDSFNDEFLSGASLSLNSTAKVKVNADSSIGGLMLNGGDMEFVGSFDLDGTDDSLAQLNVTSLKIDNSTDIKVALPSEGLAQDNISSTQLLTADDGEIIRTLIVSDAEIEGDINKITLNEGQSDLTGSVSVGISNAGDITNAAYGIYSYAFGMSENNKSIGITFDLTEVNIIDGKTLQLSGVADPGATLDKDDILSAQLTGNGNLEITANSVVLNNSQNSYSGLTTVKNSAVLQANEGSLGSGGLVVESGSTYVNTGSNDTSYIDVASTLNLEDALTVNNTGNGGASEISGSITGSGTLSVEDGTLLVSGTNAAYSGAVNLKNDTVATINSGNALGTGTLTLNEDATLNVDVSSASGSDTVVLSNVINGETEERAGQVNVDLGTNTRTFDFAQAQTSFDGSLSLTNAEFDWSQKGSLFLDNADLNVGNGATVVVNQTTTERGTPLGIGNLTLSGGTLEYGKLSFSQARNDMFNVIDLGGDGTLSLADGTVTSVHLDAGAASSLTAGGSELLEADNGTKIVLIDNAVSINFTDDDINSRLDLSLDNYDNSQNLYQEVNASSEGEELVAKVTRTFGSGSGSDGLDDAFGTDGDNVYINYSISAIDLQYEEEGYGLTIDASGADGDKTLSAHLTGVGNIVYAGGDIIVGNTANASDNNYTGTTYVKGGSVTLADTNALGAGDLDISGGTVNLNGYAQTVAALNTTTAGSLSGTGSLTINKSSHVFGANNDFSANITLASDDSDIVLTDVDGLGSGSFTFSNSGASITYSGANGYIGNSFIGTGSLIVGGENSSIVSLSGDNSVFSGNITVNNGSQLTAQALDTDTLNKLIGTADLTVDGNGTMTLGEDNAWTLVNILSGSGTLNLSSNNEEFKFDSADIGSTFTGNIVLTNSTFALSDENGSIGAINAGALQNSTLTLSTGNVTTVDGDVELGSLSLGSDSTLKFTDTGTPGATDGSHLELSGSLNLDGGTIALNVGDVDASSKADNNPLTMQDALSADDSGKVIYELIHAQGGVTGSDYALIVNDDSLDNSALSVYINNDSDETVATGTYDYGLQVDDDSLDLAYKLIQVDIHKGKTLSLSGLDYDGNTLDDYDLSAQVTGNGNLEITSGTISLSGAGNSYTGATTVNSGASLIAATDNALGDTSSLNIEAGGSVVFDSVNTVHGIDAQGNITLNEGSSLTFVANDASSDGTISGSLQGSGSLAVQGAEDGKQAVLTVTKANTAFTGAVSLENAAVTITDINALGKVESSDVNGISIDNSSTLTLDLAASTDETLVLNRKVTGDGTIKIDFEKTDQIFRFADYQESFTGTLDLQSGSYVFLEERAENILKDASLIVGENGSVDVGVNSGDENTDRLIGNLTLGGGLIDFGSLSYSASAELQEQRASHLNLQDIGYLNLLSDTQTTFSIDQNATNDISFEGSEVLDAIDGSGVVFIHGIKGLQIDGSDTDAQDIDISKYISMDLDDTEALQTISQALSDDDDTPVKVAKVHRDFGEIEYGDLGNNGVGGATLGNSVYASYKIDNIELIHESTGDASQDSYWQGLSLSASGSEPDDLNVQISGDGNLVFRGGTINVGYEQDGNSYTGNTWVTDDSTIVFISDNAFGDTEALRIDDGSSVDFASYSQTIGDLFAYGDNALKASEGAAITVNGESLITGSNEDFKASSITFKEDVEINDVEALGSSTITLADGKTFTIADSDSSDGNVFDNTINESSGSLIIGKYGTSGEITLGGSVALTGGTEVKDNWTLKAEVDADTALSDRIGSGALTLNEEAKADFAYNFGSDGNTWNWDGHEEPEVKGNGTLIVSTGGSGNHFSFSQDAKLSDFSGNLELKDTSFALSDEDNLNALKDIGVIAGEGSILEVAEGETVLGDSASTSDNSGDLTLAGGSIKFEGSVTPGAHQDGSDEAEAHLTVTGTLDLGTGGKGSVRVDISDPVNPDYVPDTNDSLTMQDVLNEDSKDLTVGLITADGGIEGDVGGVELLDKDGNPIASDSDVTLTIADNGGDIVADGTYGYDLNVVDNELGISYQLKDVTIRDGKTLSLSEAAGQDNDLQAGLHGSGNLQIDSGDISLSNGNNDYTGETIVGSTSGNAQLTVSEGALGDTLKATVHDGSTLIIAGDNTAHGLDVDGTLQINADTDFTVKGDTDSSISGALTGDGGFKLDGGKLTVSGGNSDFNGASTITGDGEMVLLGTQALGSGTVTIDEGSTLNLAFMQGGSEAPAALTNELQGSGSVFIGSGSVELTQDSSDFAGNFVLSGGSLSVSDIMQLGNEDTVSLNGSGSLNLDLAQDTVFDFALDSGIGVNKDGDGILTLTDKSLNAGSITVNGGGAVFGSAEDDGAIASDIDVTLNSGTFLAGFGSVGSLTLNAGSSVYIGGVSGYNLNENGTSSFAISGKTVNNGTIQIGKTGTDLDVSDVGNTFITSEYEGSGGTVALNTYINGSSSSSDELIVSDKASGYGILDVNLLASSTESAVRYVELVSVQGESSVDFSLAQTLKIGDTYYRLMRSQDQTTYYLMSSNTDPGTGAWDINDVKRPDAGSRAALASLASRVFDLSLHGHIGEKLYFDPISNEVKKSSLWIVQRGDWSSWDDDSGQLDVDGHTFTTHLGADIYSWQLSENYTLHAGVLGSIADASYDVDSSLDGTKSSAEFTSYSLGMYAALENGGESGAFASVQLRYNWFDNEISDLSKESYSTDGFSLTLEAGWDQKVASFRTDGGYNIGWSLQPQIRTHMSFIDSDHSLQRNSERYAVNDEDNIMLRLGLRSAFSITHDDAPSWSSPYAQLYLEGAWINNSADFEGQVINEFGTSSTVFSGGDYGEFRMGVELQFTENVQAWGEFHYVGGENNYESTGGMLGIKYNF